MANGNGISIAENIRRWIPAAVVVGGLIITLAVTVQDNKAQGVKIAAQEATQSQAMLERAGFAKVDEHTLTGMAATAVLLERLVERVTGVEQRLIAHETEVRVRASETARRLQALERGDSQ